jgi:hypothetical protein
MDRSINVLAKRHSGARMVRIIERKLSGHFTISKEMPPYQTCAVHFPLYPWEQVDWLSKNQAAQQQSYPLKRF